MQAVEQEQDEQVAEAVVDQERERRRRFLVGRQRGIGSSDLLGTEEYPKILDGGALTVYQDKTRPVTDEDVDQGRDRIDLMRGTLMEPLATALYWRETGRRGRRETGQLFHPSYPGVMTSADGTIFSDPTRPPWQQGTGGLEIKSPRSHVMQALVEHGTREGIIMQLQHSIAVRRLSWGSYGFCSLEHSAGPILTVDVAADPVLGEFLLEVSARFWSEHVVPRIPPDPVQWAQLLEKAPPVRETGGATVVLEPEQHADAVLLMRRMLDVMQLRREVEDAKNEISEKLDQWLRDTFPDASRFQAPGLGKVTRVTSRRPSLDVDLLKQHRPIDRDAFVRYMRDITSVIGDQTEHIEQKADELALDIGRFTKPGEPFSYLLSTPAREQS